MSDLTVVVRRMDAKRLWKEKLFSASGHTGNPEYGV